MDGKTSITVNAILSVSDETARRCMTFLEIWMDDNPDKNIVCDTVPLLDGRVARRLKIRTLKKQEE